MPDKISLWIHVIRSDQIGKSNPLVTCRYCLANWTSSSTQRINDHLSICPDLPLDLYSAYDRVIGQPPAKRKPGKRARNNEPRARFCDSCSTEENETLSKLLAEAVNSAGIPASFVENPSFRRFLWTIRPAFNPPTQWEVANTPHPGPEQSHGHGHGHGQGQAHGHVHGHGHSHGHGHGHGHSHVQQGGGSGGGGYATLPNLLATQGCHCAPGTDCGHGMR